MNILFLQTAHSSNDDRVRYHQQVSLEEAGHSCSFACNTAEKYNQPEVVICDTPKAVWKARRKWGKRVRIVYDITEWYPSKKYLRNEHWYQRPFKWVVMALASYWTGWSADAFLFGESHKARPFRILFPWKPSMLLPYYPLLKYIPQTKPHDLINQVRLFYAGPKTEEKGFFRVRELVRLCEEKIPGTQIVLTVVNGLRYEEFCAELAKHDIFLDLRHADIENTRCLPIKLFYYLAAGRPVIYSDLKAIRQGVPEIIEDSLVQPNDIQQAAVMVCELVKHPAKYTAICNRNRQLAEKRYNWESQKEAFVQFIQSLK